MAPYQLTVVCSQVVGIGVWEEEQLGVRMDGEVGLDGSFVAADEVGDVLDFNLRLRSAPTVNVAAGIVGGSESCVGENKKNNNKRIKKHVGLD